MIEADPLDRIPARIALQHSWITRKETSIPVELFDWHSLFETEDEIKKILYSLYFIGKCDK